MNLNPKQICVLTEYNALALSVVRKFTGNLEDAKDISQDFCLKKLLKPEQLEKFEAEPKSYFIASVKNFCKTALKRKGRNITILVENFTDDVTAYNDTYANLFSQDVQGMIQKLPENQRKAFLLHIEGYDNNEIASALGIIPTAVKQLLYRAREKMKLLYKNGG